MAEKQYTQGGVELLPNADGTFRAGAPAGFAPPTTNPILNPNQIAPTQPLNIGSSFDMGGAALKPLLLNDVITDVTKPFSIANASPDVLKTNDPTAFVNGLKSYQDYFNEIDAPDTATQTEADRLRGEASALLPATAGKSQALADEESRLGIPDMSKRLAGINADILSKTAEYEATVKGMEGTGRGLTTTIVRGQQAQARQQAASEIGLLQARALGLQGQIDSATKTADRAIDLKYASIEDAINIKMKQLELLGPELDKDERRQAAALERQYADQKEKLNELKAEQKENLKLAFEANVETPYANKGGKFYQVADGTPFPNEQAFFKAAGVKSFAEAYAKKLVTDVDQGLLDERSLTTNLAEKYWDAGISPSDNYAAAVAKAKTSKIYNKSITIGDGSGTGPGKKGYPTTGEVKDWLLEAKRKNPSMSYYDLWGQLADKLKETGVNPGDFDEQFWTVLHPEGAGGFDKFVKKAEKATDNPFE